MRKLRHNLLNVIYHYWPGTGSRREAAFVGQAQEIKMMKYKLRMFLFSGEITKSEQTLNLTDMNF